jgi:DNA-binding NarL/FixJ family response regulator
VTDNSRPIRVLVVDDDRMAAAGITAILSTSPDIVVVGHCTDGDQVVGAVAQFRPDLVLCDVRMPRMDGIAVARALAELADSPKLLMMTAFDDSGRVLDAVAAGATGFLLKDEDPHRIIDAVLNVSAGDAAYSPRAARQLSEWVQQARSDDAQREALAKMGMLTDREREFALALVTGATDAELAAQFFVAETTVKSALTSIKTKWGSRNRTQIAVVVARSGLV